MREDVPNDFGGRRAVRVAGQVSSRRIEKSPGLSIAEPLKEHGGQRGSVAHDLSRAQLLPRFAILAQVAFLRTEPPNCDDDHVVFSPLSVIGEVAPGLIIRREVCRQAGGLAQDRARDHQRLGRPDRSQKKPSHRALPPCRSAVVCRSALFPMAADKLVDLGFNQSTLPLRRARPSSRGSSKIPLPATHRWISSLGWP